MQKLGVAGMVVLAMCGCTTVCKNDGGNSAIAPDVIKDVIREKYEVGSTTVSAGDQVNCFLRIFQWGTTANHQADLADVGGGLEGLAKRCAYANACDAGKCDSLVGTKYTVTTEDYLIFQRVSAQVTGYPVKLVGCELIPVTKSIGISKPSTVSGGSGNALDLKGKLGL